MKKTIWTVIWLLFWLMSWSQTPNQEGLPAVEFSVEGGFFSEPVLLRLETPESLPVYYTLDGSTPDRQSLRYREPIRLAKSTVVRAVAYRGRQRGVSAGHSYLIDEPRSGFLVISLSMTPAYLFSPDEGLFVPGPEVLDTSWRKSDANFWSRTELDCNTEIFEPDGRCVFNSELGFRLFGGMSRLFPQKSIALVAREEYGERRIRYPVFGKDRPKNFKYLVLRNSGSDFGRSHFRDALMTGLVDGKMDLEVQAYRPAHVYINGRYWGIYNVREKINKHFVNDYFDLDKDSIDLLEHRITLKQGTKQRYKELLHYLETHDLSVPAHYAAVSGMMDIGNFMDLQIAQIYFDNQDAGGNIKFWREQTAKGRWRWILYDTDWGFGLHQAEAYRNNSLAFHTETKGPAWPNPPWSTFILRKLLENPEFEAHFLNRFADHLNETFATERVLAHLEDKYRTLLTEMPRHLARWRLSREEWLMHIERMRTFARERPAYLRGFLMDRFDTGAQRMLRAGTTAGGRILVNRHLEVEQEDWEGWYFAGLPVRIRAIPNYGYRFVRWEGIEMPPEVREFSLSLREGDQQVRAVFEPYVHPLAGHLVINEVGPNNKKSSDWLELVNYSEQPVNLRNWIITDLKHEYRLPEVVIRPNDYLVICERAEDFRKEFPEAYHILGGLPFGLNKTRETLSLYDPKGAVVDSIGYLLAPTDSVFSLSLLLPHLDNSDPENWRLLPGPGTPNAPNPYYVESRIRAEQQQWMQLGMALGALLLGLLALWLRRQGLLRMSG